MIPKKLRFGVHTVLLCWISSTFIMCTSQETTVPESKETTSKVTPSYSITASSLSIRKEANKNADRIGLLPFGTAVKASPVGGGEWYQLTDLPGFVFGQYLSQIPPSKEKSLLLAQATYYDDANLFQEVELKNGTAVYHKSMSFYYEENPFQFTQKGTYSVTKEGLTVTLEPTTYTVNNEKRTAPATTLSLIYKSKLKGYITEDMKDVMKEAENTDYKRFTWEIENYSLTWWHVAQKKK